MKKKWAIYLLLLFPVTLSSFPFLWMILTSFKSFEETIRIPIQIFPSEWLLSNYTYVLETYPILKWYGNSLIMVLMVMLGQILLGSMAAYAFARLRFPFRNTIFMIFLSVMMVPQQIYLIPRYKMMIDWGLINTTVALWLPKIVSVFAVFFLRQFIKSLPKELDEAAKIDGCGYFRTFSSIILPLLKTPIISLAILSGLGVWKELMWPMMVIQESSKKPVIAGLAALADSCNGEYQYLMVAGVLGTIPVIILFFILQKQFVQGIASEGIKG